MVAYKVFLYPGNIIFIGWHGITSLALQERSMIVCSVEDERRKKRFVPVSGIDDSKIEQIRGAMEVMVAEFQPPPCFDQRALSACRLPEGVLVSWNKPFRKVVVEASSVALVREALLSLNAEYPGLVPDSCRSLFPVENLDSAVSARLADQALQAPEQRSIATQ